MAMVMQVLVKAAIPFHPLLHPHIPLPLLPALGLWLPSHTAKGREQDPSDSLAESLLAQLVCPRLHPKIKNQIAFFSAAVGIYLWSEILTPICGRLVLASRTALSNQLQCGVCRKSLPE
jgi:hypothetical protein